MVPIPEAPLEDAHSSQYPLLNLHHRPTIGPIRNLPVEVLVDIFLSCSLPTRLKPQLEQTPWSLGRVCSQWRRVVLDTPSLWTNIVIYPDSRHGWSMSMAVQQLRRCRNLPVSLHAYSDSPFPPRGFVDFMTSTVDTKRLQELEITGDHSWVLPLLSSNRVQIHALQRLSLDSDSERYHFNIFNTFPFKSVGSLREFVLRGISVTLKSLFQLPLQNLTLLHMPSSELGPRVAFAALSQCVSLVDCVLSITQTRGDAPLGDDEMNFLTFTLPRLEKLQLIVCGEAHCVAFIPRLNLPRLTHFSISLSEPSPVSFIHWERWYWNPAFTPAITKSGCLTSLDIRIPILPADLEDILSKSPCLSTLDVPDGDGLPQSILRRISSGDLIPQLSSLRCPLHPAILDMLEEMSAEKMSEIRLREMVLYGRRTKDPLSLSRIQGLRGEGWNITLRN